MPVVGVLEFPLREEPPGQQRTLQRKREDLHVRPRRCAGSILRGCGAAAARALKSAEIISLQLRFPRFRWIPESISEHLLCAGLLRIFRSLHQSLQQAHFVKDTKLSKGPAAPCLDRSGTLTIASSLGQ